MRRFLVCTVLFASSWAAFNCGKPGISNDERWVARINDAGITLFEFESVMSVPGSDTAANRLAREHTLDMMISQKLIALEGIRLGYQESLAGAIEKNRDAGLERLLGEYASKLPLTHQDIAAESTLEVTECDLKLIEVATYDTALTIIALLKGGVPFESLAVRYNRASIPGLGPDGDLGYQSNARNPLEVVQALKTMKPGDVSSLIVRNGIYYDFIKLAGRRPSPRADSLAAGRSQIEKNARSRKIQEFLLGLHSRVQYDEGALDYLTSQTDSVRPEDSLVVVARQPNGYKTRIGYLLPIVRSYGTIHAALKRRALKEAIERDVLAREASRLGLDKTPAYRNQYQRMIEATVYQYYYQKAIGPDPEISLDQAQTYFQQHPENFPGKRFEDIGEQLRIQLQGMQHQQRYQALVQELRGRAKIEIDHQFLATAKPKAR